MQDRQWVSGWRESAWQAFNGLQMVMSVPLGGRVPSSAQATVELVGSAV